MMILWPAFITGHEAVLRSALQPESLLLRHPHRLHPPPRLHRHARQGWFPGLTSLRERRSYDHSTMVMVVVMMKRPMMINPLDLAFVLLDQVHRPVPHVLPGAIRSRPRC
jgi:hypothetical protein